MIEVARPLPIPDGVDLVKALDGALDGGAGWVQAVGTVIDPVLAAGAAGGRDTELLGPLLIVSLQGPVGGPYLVTLARPTAGTAELFAGELRRARARGIAAILLPFIDTAAASAYAPGEGDPLAASRDLAEADAKGEATAGTTSWATRAAASAEAARAAESAASLDDATPERGDRVQHFAFGLCDVLLVDGESLRIRDVRATGRVREIRLDRLTVLPPTLRDGKRTFKLLRRE